MKISNGIKITQVFAPNKDAIESQIQRKIKMAI